MGKADIFIEIDGEFSFPLQLDNFISIPWSIRKANYKSLFSFPASSVICLVFFRTHLHKYY